MWGASNPFHAMFFWPSVWKADKLFCYLNNLMGGHKFEDRAAGHNPQKRSVYRKF